MLTQAYQPPSPAKARATAILCALMALATATVTAWFVVEGIQATEPASTARWAKVAAGVLLLVLELGAFGVAAQWIEHGRVLRSLGWFVLALEITFMSLAQISIGTTAGKVAAAASGTAESRTQQAEDYRKAAALREAEAEKLRQSKHSWKRDQADQKTAEAATLTARAAAAVEARASEATGEAATSTPLVEIVGARGLIALSVALSLALSLGGIVMMHVAGSLWRRASGEFVPVEVQILTALHELRQRMDSDARPTMPRKVLEVPQDEAPALPAPQAGEPAAAAPRLEIAPPVAERAGAAPGGAVPGGTALPWELAGGAAPKAESKPPAGHSMSFGRWSVQMPQNRTAAELAALAALGAAAPGQAAPAVLTQAQPDVLTRAQPQARPQAGGAPSGAAREGAQQPAETVLTQAQQQAHPQAGVMPSETAREEAQQPAEAVLTQAHLDVLTQAQPAQQRRARATGAAVRDTGTDPSDDGARFARVRKAIKAGKLLPSLRAIKEAENCGTEVARRYLDAMEADGLVERHGRVWVRKTA